MIPKKPDKRSKVIRVYVTEYEEQALTQYSKEQNISMSDILRSLWLAFQEQQQEPTQEE